jgi:hypothetical protein
MPPVSADGLMWLAWDLEADLPGTGALLAAGQLTQAKAKAVDTALEALSPGDKAAAEQLILPELPGKTYGEVQRLACQAAATVDPGSAARRRRDAEQHKSRVTMFREESGAVGLSGRDLPAGLTLAAFATVCARAADYQDSGAFPADTRMDQYRAAAYLDLINGVPAHIRIASGELGATRAARDPADDDGTESALAGETAETTDDSPEADDSDTPGSGDTPGDGAPGDGDTPGSGPDGSSPDGSSPDGPAGGCPPAGAGVAGDEAPPRRTDLVIPLATLLGLADRPGESHGLGVLDPDLCRDLAVTAMASAWTTVCVTVTDPDGIATGHGCARRAGPRPRRSPARPAAADRPSLPARLNLTISAARLTELRQPGSPAPPGKPGWHFTPVADEGPPDGYGTWTLTLPDGRRLAMALEPVPTHHCDHRHETQAYQPGAKLRHLVQVRDYTCTFPTCNRHARESDFEHCHPYHQGGRTCACNAGARSRACHQVKQSEGWTVTQPRPGWHQWQTPTGRIYIQGPKRYPV